MEVATLRGIIETLKPLIGQSSASYDGGAWQATPEAAKTAQKTFAATCAKLEYLLAEVMPQCLEDSAEDKIQRDMMELNLKTAELEYIRSQNKIMQENLALQALVGQVNDYVASVEKKPRKPKPPTTS